MAEDLKVVGRYSTPIEAEMARNRLEAEGVRAFLADAHSIGWLWHLGTALQGIKVLVAESDLPRAVEILESVGRPQPAEELQLPWTCPKCRTEVDGGLEVCWACGTTVEGVEDPDFQSASAPALKAPAAEAEEKGPPHPLLAAVVGLFIPAAIFNMLIGLDVFERAANSPALSALVFLFAACELIVVIGIFHWFYYAPPSSPIEIPEDRLAAVDALSPDEAMPPDLIALAAVARRACLAAVLGMAFCPPLLNIYSVRLIIKYELYRPVVCRQSGLLVYGAIVLNVLVFALVLLLFLLGGGLAP